MPTIYISDSGDDKNDGLSLQTAVYSLKRAKKLQGGRNDYSWHFGPRAWKRIQKELSDKKKKSDYRRSNTECFLWPLSMPRLAEFERDLPENVPLGFPGVRIKRVHFCRRS